MGVTETQLPDDVYIQTTQISREITDRLQWCLSRIDQERASPGHVNEVLGDLRRAILPTRDFAFRMFQREWASCGPRRECDLSGPCEQCNGDVVCRIVDPGGPAGSGVQAFHIAATAVAVSGE